jgi:hypothetical protein
MFSDLENMVGSYHHPKKDHLRELGRARGLI